jgi:hypothetical protein
MGAFVEGVWHLHLQCTFFQAHSLDILCFFHVLGNELKAKVLEWCPNNDSVIHKYLAEMRIMDHDETPFLSVV